jgi:hypothetical protein
MRCSPPICKLEGNSSIERLTLRQERLRRDATLLPSLAVMRSYLSSRQKIGLPDIQMVLLHALLRTDTHRHQAPVSNRLWPSLGGRWR